MQGGTVGRGALTIQYNASVGSYTVAYGGTQTTFSRAARTGERFPGEAGYLVSAGPNGGEFLTILSVPFISGSFATDIGFNRYVAQGYWQRNTFGPGDTQATTFSSFVFGQSTPTSAMPRTGAAHWVVDIFGALTTPGKELRTVSGAGSFVVDFGPGAFIVEANLDESQFLTTGGAAGSLRLRSGGLLGSDGTFQGPLSYDGSVQLAGTLAGRFFGPAADEVGATFEATGGSSVLSGAFTGQRSRFAADSSGIPNITLGNMLTQEFQYGPGAVLSRRVFSSTQADVSAILGSQGRVEIGPQGLLSVTDNQINYIVVDSDLISPPNAQFAVYRKDGGNFITDVAVYRNDLSTQAIALTYTSFIKFNRLEAANGAPLPDGHRNIMYYPFGIATDSEVMRGQRGTASYTGVTFADAAQRGQNQFSLSGSTDFSINFNAGTYNGVVTLSGLAQGGFSQDTGRWTFANNLSGGYMTETPLAGNLTVSSMGSILPVFYGPNGQEIAAPFAITIGNDLESQQLTRIAGIAIAKQTGP